MSELVNDLRAVVDACRGIMGELGFREHSVTLRKTSWTGGRTGDGDKIIEDFPLYVGVAQNPKVRFPNQKDLALGLMSKGTITIGPLTPQFTQPDGITTSGVVRDLVAMAALERSDTMQLLVTGPQCPRGVLYRIENVNVDKPLRIIITAVSVTGN
jgi:hypothetical protein